MSNAVFNCSLDIFVEHPAAGAETRMEALLYFVEAFEGGGSAGKVNLAATTATAVVAEFDRIRAQKVVTFYLGSVNLMPTGKLIDLSKSAIKNFSVAFRVHSYKNGEKKSSSTIAIVADAAFLETPVPVGGTPPVLKIKLKLSDIRQFRAAGGEDGATAVSYQPVPRRLEAEIQV